MTTVKATAIPGGSRHPAAKIGPDGTFARADLHMRNRRAFHDAGDKARAEMPETAAIIDKGSGTSVFDPVLCELVYRWFCPPGGLVLDPFAGGSVRGIVAAKLGRRYIGVELRAEQIAANRQQADQICPTAAPAWIEGDARDLPSLLPADARADLLFSCPPYGGLEVYSDDPRDISGMDHAAFLAAYTAIIAAACDRLHEDRFACFVVGDFRDAAGFYHGFPSETVVAFQAAGLRLYNEAVLVTALGSLPIRAAIAFEKSRKLGKTHQNVLVFCKGDPEKATAAIGPVECGEMSDV